MMVLGTKCFPQMCEDLSAEPQNPHKPNVVEVVFNPSMHSYLEIGCGRGKFLKACLAYKVASHKRNKTKDNKQQLMFCDLCTHTHATYTRIQNKLSPKCSDEVWWCPSITLTFRRPDTRTKDRLGYDARHSPAPNKRWSPSAAEKPLIRFCQSKMDS